ncbi:MAG TPA: 23S rRNA (adenine(2030)-N(6))-methyltransferase RlmJ [Candidatus Competibacter sp.]|nr:23S rRNA (adenine(2030)-N(6))-methyltransferase RlmJ [Candidatus Competibacteraceae bacterium]HRE55508.1 23S rRNA (adenine(2030)-N(6))-methyltransferase RlmJ [Candidatus Competibacter sp.]HUM93868.1 23S rRNA (adenine(2030)-N(6))-methyltransferase RlmJ [Candidatus Competibacter sp.]
MLGYRHGFHAGNFADVFKHAVLVALIQALRDKDKPFRVFDTHAGAGRYDLTSAPAQKNREFDDGVGQLWGQTGLGLELDGYLERVRALNPTGPLRWYPGSPRIIRDLLRPGDKLVLTELHPGEFPQLAAEFEGDRQVAVRHGDGYALLESLLPPPERRGLVLLDPAYERKDEFERVAGAVSLIHRRWANGIIAIWYPILDRAPSLRFQRALQASAIPAILCAELELYADGGPPGLRGCGMILINPPWKLDRALKRWLPELSRRLRLGVEARTRLEWLAPAP